MNDQTLQSVNIATMFKALGDPTRIRIFEFLRQQQHPIAIDEDGNVRMVSGPTVGEVCCHLTGIERATSTVSHHLKELRLAGLIRMERRGKNMICSLNGQAVAELTTYLKRSGVEELLRSSSGSGEYQKMCLPCR